MELIFKEKELALELAIFLTKKEVLVTDLR